MTLRMRLTMAALVAAALAVVGVSVLGVSYSRHRLRDQVDSALLSQARQIAANRRVSADGHGPGPGPGGPGAGGARGATATAATAATGPRGHDDPDHDDNAGGMPDGRLGAGTAPFQIIDATGAVLYTSSQDVRDLTVDDSDKAVASGTQAFRLRDAFVDGVHLRVATVPLDGGNRAVVVARQIDDIDGTVSNLVVGFSVIGAIGLALAGILAWLVARRAMAPVARLSAAAERVAFMQDPELPVPETGGTELVKLGRSLNVMLRSLGDARQHERRLIDDAAHELRTPLTSLRTNVEVLASGRQIDEGDRVALLRDVREQVEEFTALVGDLDALARDQADPGAPEEIRLEPVVHAAVRRAQRRAGSVQIGVIVDRPGAVVGHAAMLERALLNILDNAVKWSPDGGQVSVQLHGTTVVVDDQGPGIATADLPHVFDRFWRAPGARAMPGSGLGLAIVKQVVESHGGTVAINVGPQARGTSVSVTLPEAR